MNVIYNITFSSEEEYKRKIGERLVAARKAKGLTRELLCDLVTQRIHTGQTMRPASEVLNFSRYRSWEDGTNLIHISFLPILCEILDCEVGYILCEYDEPHKEIADICKETSLSASAVNTLISKAVANKIDSHTFRMPGKSELDLLSLLIENQSFWTSLSDLSLYSNPLFAFAFMQMSEATAYNNWVYEENPALANEPAAVISAIVSLAVGHFTVAAKSVLESVTLVDE